MEISINGTGIKIRVSFKEFLCQLPSSELQVVAKVIADELKKRGY